MSLMPHEVDKHLVSTEIHLARVEEALWNAEAELRDAEVTEELRAIRLPLLQKARQLTAELIDTVHEARQGESPTPTSRMAGGELLPAMKPELEPGPDADVIQLRRSDTAGA